MIFRGIQKVTLLDYPEHVACTLFTGGCNFCCPFCQNASLVFDTSPVRISEAEVLFFLENRQGYLQGVCITGGEPTIHKDLPEFIAKVKKLGFNVKLDTNGTSPEMLRQLVESKLIDYVAMDIKHVKAKYTKATGILEGLLLEQVEESIDYLLRGVIEYEFRTTVVKELHSPEDVGEIARRIVGTPRYFLQNFRDNEEVIKKGFHGFDEREKKILLDAAKVWVPEVAFR
ncbi:MAG: anaerobic ribonucleoside-triphosphate reductase activating protein [Ruminococcaceae bacterium]|nr:anaerobic ribonucleoside-triphosphate reductase activating protein [Oscillospiraceae bacterium]